MPDDGSKRAETCSILCINTNTIIINIIVVLAGSKLCFTINRSLLFVLSFALCCVIINCFVFLIHPFHVCFLVLYVFLSILCDLCFLYCFSQSIYLFFYLCTIFTDHCHRVETQLQLINISYIHPHAYKNTRKRAITCTTVPATVTYDVLATIRIKPAHFWFLGMAKLPSVKLLKASRTASMHVTVRFNYVDQQQPL